MFPYNLKMFSLRMHCIVRTDGAASGLRRLRRTLSAQALDSKWNAEVQLECAAKGAAAGAGGRTV